jgi:hypothetical protein
MQNWDFVRTALIKRNRMVAAAILFNSDRTGSVTEGGTNARHGTAGSRPPTETGPSEALPLIEAGGLT